MEPRNYSEIVKVIRTLLTSAKNGLLIKQIIDDYKEIEGKEIPFKSLGYNNLEDLLCDTNDFALIETKQGIKVIAKPSKDAYVNKSAPNSPSKSKTKGCMIPPQRALRPNPDNQWNGTAYSQAYTQMPNRSVKKAFTHPAKLLQAAYRNGNGNGNGNSNGGAYRPILKQSNIKQVPMDEIPNSTAAEATNNTMSQTRPFPMRQQNNQQITGNPNTWMNQRNSPIERISKKINEPPQQATKNSVQSRLAIQKNLSIDVTDFVAPQQTPEAEHSTFDYSNSGISQKVSTSGLK